RAEREVEEERPVGADGLEVADPADRSIYEVLAQVVAVPRASRRLYVMVVFGQFRVELVRLALHEAVEAVESFLEGPVCVGAGGRALVHGREVPLAGGVGGVAVFSKELREGRRAWRDRTAHVREAAIPV